MINTLKAIIASMRKRLGLDNSFETITKGLQKMTAKLQKLEQELEAKITAEHTKIDEHHAAISEGHATVADLGKQSSQASRTADRLQQLFS